MPASQHDTTSTSSCSPFIQAKLDDLPSQPGVYLMKGKDDEVLYIGKARVLADRVRSYFQRSHDLTPKTQLMLSLVADIETLLTQSELEALILESNLVKRYRPRFNVVLRDDKHYPYLRFPVREHFPRLSIVRRVKQDGALYFGPYVPAGALRETLKVIRKVFPLATCKIDINGTADRACLEFEIKRCFAPCTGNQTREEYHRIVKQVRMFLEGKDTELLKNLRGEMEAAAHTEAFEEAARLRDRIFKIQRTLEKQRVAQIGPVDQDVLGLSRLGPVADIQMLFIRGGLLIGRKDFFWSDAGEVSDEELLQSTIEQFYNKELIPPKELVVSTQLLDSTIVQEWLSSKKGDAVRIVAPVRGRKRHLVVLAEENATAAMYHHLRAEAADQEAGRELQSLLHLPRLPLRIEGFDISNTMGTHSVASMVVWEYGKSKKSEYRRFRIKTVEGANDFASMCEVVTRRYGGSLAISQRLSLPDLILIDGGLGQVEAAKKALGNLSLTHIPIIGLAKARGEKEDRVFLSGNRNPITLSPSASSTKLLKRIRDEAHRFAITYHRTIRGKALIFPERGTHKQKTMSQKRGTGRAYLSSR
ncbi:MAG: excinuclease ABC subunit UvrC [Nitrospirales bacterium]|nr:excinuclease ABC subunit UvrC [Nitrospirales bacterium]